MRPKEIAKTVYRHKVLQQSIPTQKLLLCRSPTFSSQIRHRSTNGTLAEFPHEQVLEVQSSKGQSKIVVHPLNVAEIANLLPGLAISPN
jgi:hypothetical protein